jgi:hypothetical protein
MRGLTLVRTAALVLVLLACTDPISPPNTPLGLRVWAEIRPSTVRFSDSTQLLRIRVLASNPGNRTLTLISGGPPYRMTSDPANSIGLAESFRIARKDSFENAGPGADWFGDSLWVFQPGQTYFNEQELTLAEWRKRSFPQEPGEYRVRSYFNGREGASATFRIVP